LYLQGLEFFRMMRLFYILLLTTCFFTLRGQLLQYEVVRGDKSLGLMKAQRYWEGKEVHYHIQSDVEFKILFTFSVSYEQKEIFLNDTLIGGSGYNKLNGSTQKETNLRKDKNYYRIAFDGIDNRLHEDAIIQSMSQIHFKEPDDGASYFSQHFGQFVTFKKIGEHRYLMVSPDGENEYTYENGYCTEIKVVRDYATFYFKMKPETLARVKNKSDTLFHR
jgi:hypothetical protein